MSTVRELHLTAVVTEHQLITREPTVLTQDVLLMRS